MAEARATEEGIHESELGTKEQYNIHYMAGHIVRLQRERVHPIQQCTGRKKTAEEREGSRIRHGKVLSTKIWKRWVSGGMGPAGSLVTVSETSLSHNAPRGTGRPKSK